MYRYYTSNIPVVKGLAISKPYFVFLLNVFLIFEWFYNELPIFIICALFLSSSSLSFTMVRNIWSCLYILILFWIRCCFYHYLLLLIASAAFFYFSKKIASCFFRAFLITKIKFLFSKLVVPYIKHFRFFLCVFETIRICFLFWFAIKITPVFWNELFAHQDSYFHFDIFCRIISDTSTPLSLATLQTEHQHTFLHSVLWKFAILKYLN